MSFQSKPLNQITQEAIALLFKEIGIANTLRFLNQFSIGYGNYTEEREPQFKDLTLDEILQQMKESRSTIAHAPEVRSRGVCFAESPLQPI